MKKLKGMLTVCLSVLLVAGVMSFPAHAEEEDGYTYRVNEDETVTIIGYSKEGGDVVIPDKLGGREVTSIFDWVFYDCSTLTSVTIPGSVTSIGYAAFCSCSALKSVTIGQGATSIGMSAFNFCGALTSIKLPDSVTDIGGSAFEYTAYYNNEENWADGVLYIGDKDRYLINAREDISGDIVIKDSVKLIADSAFSGCSDLTSVKIPDSVTSIGNAAFEKCSGLTSVSIGDGVTDIGGNVFVGCNALTSITVNEDNKNYASDDGVLFNKGRTRLIQYPANRQEGYNYNIPDGVTSIGGSAFSGCSGLTSVIIPDSVTSIGNSAFSGCSGLTSAVMGNGVEEIGWSAFEGCKALKSVTIPAGVTTIGDYAFSGCSALSEINVEEGNKDYAGVDGVLSNADKTRLILCPPGKEGEYVIPEYVTSIGESAFARCSGLTSVVIGNGVTSIEDNAFYGCVNLASVTIGNGVESIGRNAFYNTYYYNSVDNWDSDILYIEDKYLIAAKENISGEIDIKESVKLIGDYAFNDCENITSVTIPAGMTGVGEYAFYNCNALKSINVEDGNEVYASVDGVLLNANKTKLILCPPGKEGEYVIPKDVTSIGEKAFGACGINFALKSVTIPAGVTTIGELAFSACANLASVTIGNGVTSIGRDAFHGTAYYRNEDNWDDGILYIGEGDRYLIGANGSVVSGEIDIKEGVKLIGDYVFSGCENITSVIIPSGVTSIGDGAFSECKALVSAIIPASVTKIGVDAFSNCEDLKIYGYAGSEAERYTRDNDIPFNEADILGDINDDGEVNIVDARWALQASSGNRELTVKEMAAANVNKDKNVNIIDARWLLQVSSGNRIL